MRRLFLGLKGRVARAAKWRGVVAGLAISLGASVVPGCSFTPEPPPELNSINDPQKVPTVTVELILAGDEIDDRVSWEQAARLEASNAKVIFSVARKTNAEPASKVADLIREAVKRGIRALVVEPVDGPEFVEAVNDARDQGVGVVVLDKTIPGRDASKTYPTVHYTPFEEPAGQLVESAKKRAEADGLAADGTALVLVNPKYGPDTEVRVAALIKALEKAGVPKVERFEFPGDHATATKAVTDKLEADPKITLVVCHEENGFVGAVAARMGLKGKRKFEVIGTASSDRIMNPNVLSACPGMVERNVPTLSRQAVKVAVALARGETVPSESIILLPFIALTPSDKVAEARDAAATAAQPPPPDADKGKPLKE